jgi:phage terminase small subunit
MARQALTSRQLAFAQHYAINGNASAAYRACYNVAKETKDSSCARNGVRILENPEVQAKLAEIRKPAADAVGLTLVAHLNKLQELRDKAAEEGQMSAAITAEISRGKAVGLYIDRKELKGDGNTIVQIFRGAGEPRHG